MHRLELCSIAGQAHSSRRDNLVTRGATELLKPRSRPLLRTATFCVFQLCYEIHRGQQRDAPFIVLADLHPSLGKAERTSLPVRMTVLATVLFEDVFGQVIGAHLRQLRVGKGLGGRS